MRLKFVPIDYNYFDFEGKNYVRLVGRTEKGKKVCIIDSYEPNFWVILKKGSERKANEIAEYINGLEIKKSSRTSKVVGTKIYDKRFLGQKVRAIKVYVTNHKDAHDIASEIGDIGDIEFRREYDIPLITKYIKEKKVEPMDWYEVEGNVLGAEDFGGIATVLDVDVCIFSKKISKIKNIKFKPKILAFDIEATSTEIGKGEILMISIYGDGIKKVLSWKKSKEKQSYVEFFKNEAEMIEKFIEYVKDYNPDFLTGYFSDGFDLPYLRETARRNGIKLSIGIDGREPSFARGRIPTGKIEGIVHVDLFRFIDAVFSQYLQSETLSLNEVSSELLGEKKEDFDFERLKDMKDGDWKDFFSYNLKDSLLTYNLFMKLWPDMLELCSLVKEPIFNITRDRMATLVESYILHNLDKFNEIAEKRPMEDEIRKRRSLGKYEGAFVYEPSPGLYENLVMFDFTSMYPSIIVSYNLSKSTYLGNGRFSKKPGFFSKMLAEIIETRKKYKKELSKNPSNILRARSNAYKLLANASYGYQGFFGARYYCREAAEATTKYARENILKVIEKIKNKGYEVVYGDTDSIAFLRDGVSKESILRLLKEINSRLPGIMELDLEDFYLRGLFVSKRTVAVGAKKKYALLSDSGRLKIRGFESVRRDWCRLSRELQTKIIKLILEKGSEKEAFKILKKTIKDLNERKVPLKKLVIKTQLKKPISEYLSKGPHVIAAEKMEKSGIPVSQGMLIEYFIGETPKKTKLIREKVFLPDEKARYDVNYYLNNQILPAVENIFDVFGVNIKEAIDGKVQKKLF